MQRQKTTLLCPFFVICDYSIFIRKLRGSLSRPFVFNSEEVLFYSFFITTCSTSCFRCSTAIFFTPPLLPLPPSFHTMSVRLDPPSSPLLPHYPRFVPPRSPLSSPPFSSPPSLPPPLPLSWSTPICTPSSL